MGIKLWGWVLAAFGFLASVILFVAGQRDRAKEAAERAKAEAAGKDAVLRVERLMDEQRAAARAKSDQVEREHEERPDDKRPGGNFRR